jgi:hypothetical protein
MLIVQEPHEPSAPLNSTQSLQLHTGWNLVSWHIVPVTPNPYIEMSEILPGPPTWLTDRDGQVHTWEYGPGQSYPEWEGSGGWEWNPRFAYYILLDAPYLWQFDNRPLLSALQPITITAKGAWSDSLPGPDGLRVRWFFMGYSTTGYQKLASVPLSPVPPSGDPANFSYLGPFHWLIWSPEIEPQAYQPWDLKIVRTDDGRVYIPRAGADIPGIDQIGVLEPGKGYFLGFYCYENTQYPFEGWPQNPVWTTQSLEPFANPVSHFQFKKYTHWCYPVIIDTVDLNQTPLESGDEIAIYDGDLCVGAVRYSGHFPIVLNSWKDDIATPCQLDGYIANHPMTFKWFDVSENTEAEFLAEPGIMSAEDDPVTPTHSGFGCGAYGIRGFRSGSQVTLQLPKEFKLGQNYPNPFNAETVIPLELPQRSDVKIELFNVRGQSLGVIFNGIREAGWPKIHYNASNLASGMYFCRVTAKGLERGGKYQSVGKLLLLK